ncbi:MAG: glycosyltransferase family 2 protein [Flavobacteriales bacterium]|nr:glycosyltransferase family 2 protein [Flavobacteriales bacterium]
MNEIGVIILTKNEELHIKRCVESLQNRFKIFVVDSGSTDNTKHFLNEMNIHWVEREWVSYSDQFNWAIANFPFQVEWLFRLDADEYVDDALKLQASVTEIGKSVSGLLIQRHLRFQGRVIRYGGVNPMLHLRLWRAGTARCESKWMDEHIVLNHGYIRQIGVNIVDDNRNGLDWWLSKHVGYALRESMDMVIIHFLGSQHEELKADAKVKRNFKTWYSKLPPYYRSFLYFAYRYFYRGGFRDGKIGLRFHLLQGLWYRLMVDSLVVEILSESTSLNDAERYVMDKFGKDLLYYQR